MDDYISIAEQRLVIEALYRSEDSITSVNSFNKIYQDKIGKIGERTLLLSDFGRKIKKTKYSSYDIERFIKQVTGKEIDIDTL